MFRPAKGAVIHGKYELERKLRGGGMGTLWVACDQVLRRRVAVKLLSQDGSAVAGLSSRFSEEARIAASIASPHVVQIYDFGIHGATPFIVMELLRGEDLRDLLARSQPLPLDRVLAIFEQLLKGLDAIHTAGVIHRDVKPANVFLAQVSGEETVKLTDFGIAKRRVKGPRNTWMGQLLGTPRYMSPEQISGAGSVDARADLWSVGVILFRVVTGEHAFSTTDTAKLLRSICNDDIVAPSRIVPTLAPAVDVLVARALQRDRAARFQSAREFAGAIGAVRELLRRDRIPLALDSTPESSMPFHLTRRKTPSFSDRDELAALPPIPRPPPSSPNHPESSPPSSGGGGTPPSRRGGGGGVSAAPHS